MHDNDFTEMEIAMAYGGDYNVGGCRVDGDVKKALDEGQRMSEENDCLLLNVKVNGVFAGYIFSRAAKKLHQRIQVGSEAMVVERSVNGEIIDQLSKPCRIVSPIIAYKDGKAALEVTMLQDDESYNMWQPLWKLRLKEEGGAA